ncbi:hypothetical protein KXV33_004225 [Aspergillus fumigatus]|nr:hypothetical protein KXV33_004225 [Aspergillus fumigatus]
MRDTTPRETPTPTPTASVFESPLPLSDMFVWAPLALVVGQLEGEAEDVPVPEAVLLEAVSMLVTLDSLVGNYTAKGNLKRFLTVRAANAV